MIVLIAVRHSAGPALLLPALRQGDARVVPEGRVQRPSPVRRVQASRSVEGHDGHRLGPHH